MRLGLARSLMGWAAVCSLAACSDGLESGQVKLEKAQSVEIHADTSMGAEALTTLGETLLTPSSFMQAHQFFKAALEKDPSNFKAGLYDKLIKVALPLKGVLGPQNSPMLDYYQVSSAKNRSIRAFLENSEGPTWHKASDIQTTVAAHRDALIDLYTFLSEHSQNEDLEVQISSWAFVGLNQKRAAAHDDTNSDPISNQEWTIEGDLNSGLVAQCSNCVGGVMPSRTLAMPDLIALRQVVGGYTLYTLMATTYDLGYSPMPAGGFEDTQEFIEWIAAERNNGDINKGMLRADHRLDFLRQLGPDSVAAMNWAIENADSLCADRPNNLFQEGFCLTQKMKELDLTGMSEAFNGPSDIPALQTSLNIAAFIDNPIEDALKPFDFSEASRLAVCGNAFNYLVDPTLGGVFVNGDADQLAEDCSWLQDTAPMTETDHRNR